MNNALSLNRRALLGVLGLGGLVAASGGLSGIARASVPDPILLAQARLDDLCLQAEAMKASITPRHFCVSKLPEFPSWNSQVDDWVGFLTDAFGEGVKLQEPEYARKSHLQIRALFDGWLRAKNVDDLRALESPTIAASFMKAALAQHKLPIDAREMPNFISFATQFKPLILPYDPNRLGLTEEVLAACPPALRSEKMIFELTNPSIRG